MTIDTKRLRELAEAATSDSGATIKQYDALNAFREAANAATTAALVEHVELNGHVDIVEQCRDWIEHEHIAEGGDTSGRLRDFVESLRIVLDQLNHQRRSRNWYECAYTAGKRKLIEHALSKQAEQLTTLTTERDSLLRELERWRHDQQIEGDYVCPNELAMVNAQAEVERLTGAGFAAMNPATVAGIITERDSLRAEVNRLRVLTLNPGATMHGLTITEIAAERDSLRAECERMRAVYEAAITWSRELIGERTSYELRLEAAIDETTRKP